MKIYLRTNVYEEAKKRLKFIFDEFEEVVVCFSGGKDSTVLFHMAYIVAKEMNRLPLSVMFIDQEAEWENTIIYMREIMNNPDVKPYWYQMPIRIFNATSYLNDWLFCWSPEEEGNWMREKEEISIKENRFGTDRFKDLFGNICHIEFKGKKTAMLAGVRAEESPGRLLGLTASLCYQDITYGKKHKNPEHITFYPLYDWSYSDIWKTINDNKLTYNKIYDYQYRYGIKIQDMRISNLHHETSVVNLLYMHEFEPEIHNKLVNRLKGIHSMTQLREDNLKIKKLPYMFKSWPEYRDFLVEKLIEGDRQKNFINTIKTQDREFSENPKYKSIVKAQINAILVNDWTGTKLKNLHTRHSTKLTRARANILKKEEKDAIRQN